MAATDRKAAQDSQLCSDEAEQFLQFASGLGPQQEEFMFKLSWAECMTRQGNLCINSSWPEELRLASLSFQRGKQVSVTEQITLDEYWVVAYDHMTSGAFDDPGDDSVPDFQAPDQCRVQTDNYAVDIGSPSPTSE